MFAERLCWILPVAEPALFGSQEARSLNPPPLPDGSPRLSLFQRKFLFTLSDKASKILISKSKSASVPGAKERYECQYRDTDTLFLTSVHILRGIGEGQGTDFARFACCRIIRFEGNPHQVVRYFWADKSPLLW